jgi:hypothetical protein
MHFTSSILVLNLCIISILSLNVAVYWYNCLSTLFKAYWLSNLNFDVTKLRHSELICTSICCFIWCLCALETWCCVHLIACSFSVQCFNLVTWCLCVVCAPVACSPSQRWLLLPAWIFYASLNAPEGLFNVSVMVPGYTITMVHMIPTSCSN